MKTITFVIYLFIFFTYKKVTLIIANMMIVYQNICYLPNNKIMLLASFSFTLFML